MIKAQRDFITAPPQIRRCRTGQEVEAGRFSLGIQELFLSKRGAGECSFFFERSFFFEFSERREHGSP
ncbi:MAG: hypothetical protein WCD04_01995, partial [Terriglobia bacterium]